MLPLDKITVSLQKAFSAGSLFSLVDEAKPERKQERASKTRGGTSYHYMSEAQQKKASLQVDSAGIYRNKDGQTVTGDFLFVVLENGDIIHAPEHTDNGIHYRHSALANGKKVRAAGKFYLENGQLMIISNESGHYKPAGEALYTILQTFITHSKNPQLIFEDHTQASSQFAYQYIAQSFINNERQVLEKISVNQRTTVFINESVYETTLSPLSRFALRPRIIDQLFFAKSAKKGAPTSGATTTATAAPTSL